MSAHSLPNPASIPHLRKQGDATQLIVDGEPFLIIGGELHNSSSSSLAYMEPIWERLLALHLNTVLAPVSWELVEPQEGHFDFALVDGLIHEARRHDLRLVVLWFGSWKNGMSSYTPAWVKRNHQRFPRAQIGDGQSVEIMSTLGTETRDADAKAFAALMRHLYEVDGQENTVIMVQVENEVGVLRDSRDRSPAANEAFAGPVPPELVKQLQEHKDELGVDLRQRWEANGFRTEGSWEELFGSSVETDEFFMAWHYARYIDVIVAAGKTEYPLPMFVNAWLSSLGTKGGAASGGQKPGEWPSGGPLPHTLDIWQAGAPHVDFLSPDIYQPNYEAWCQAYTRRGNPLFVPEMRPSEDGARQVFYALGAHDALGVSPFAIDSVLPSEDNPLVRSYAALRQVAPYILEHQGKNEIVGFLLSKEQPTVTRRLGGYELEITLDRGFFAPCERGCGLIIATGPAEFLGAGFGFMVRFRSLSSEQEWVGIAASDEGQYRDGTWIPGRRLNGDETNQGREWRFFDYQPYRIEMRVTTRSAGVGRCTVYRYR